MKRLRAFLLFLAALPLSADVVYYELIHEFTLTATSTAITLQAPPPPTRTNSKIPKVGVWSNQNYTAVVRRDGTAPSGAGSAVLTPTKMNPSARNSSMLAYSASTSTGGVALTPLYEFTAGSFVPIPFNDLYCSADAASNVTVVIASTIGAKVAFVLYYEETR